MVVGQLGEPDVVACVIADGVSLLSYPPQEIAALRRAERDHKEVSMQSILWSRSSTSSVSVVRAIIEGQKRSAKHATLRLGRELAAGLLATPGREARFR